MYLRRELCRTLTEFGRNFGYAPICSLPSFFSTDKVGISSYHEKHFSWIQYYRLQYDIPCQQTSIKTPSTQYIRIFQNVYRCIIPGNVLEAINTKRNYCWIYFFDNLHKGWASTVQFPQVLLYQ